MHQIIEYIASYRAWQQTKSRTAELNVERARERLTTALYDLSDSERHAVWDSLRADGLL